MAPRLVGRKPVDRKHPKCRKKGTLSHWISIQGCDGWLASCHGLLPRKGPPLFKLMKEDRAQCKGAASPK